MKRMVTYLKMLKLEVLSYWLYFPEVASSKHHIFQSVAHGLADHQLRS